MTVDLNNDPRWQRIHDHEWTCPCCGEGHGGLFDLVFSKPEFWNDNLDQSPSSEGHLPVNKLTNDFCIVENEYFFVRGVLELPIIGAPEVNFGLGIWSSLSKENFNLYYDSFNDAQQSHLGPWFGWFSNQIKGYPETLYLKCQVYPQNESQRPLVKLEPIEHPFSLEQQNGITLDRILELYALNGHDIREAF